jgi:uncharacterized membrane protein
MLRRFLLAFAAIIFVATPCLALAQTTSTANPPTSAPGAPVSAAQAAADEASLPSSPDMGGAPTPAGAPTSPGQVNAQTNTVQANVTQIEKTWKDSSGDSQMVFDATTDAGKSYHIDTSQGYQSGLRYNVKVGTRVILEIDTNPDGSTSVFLADVVRTGGVLWVFLIFVIVAIAVGLWRGLAALGGFAVTIAVLFGFVFPHILSGGNAIVYTLIGGVVMAGINMHLAHGFTRSTLAAYLGTLSGLVIALGASALFVHLASLTGLATDESTYLYWRVGNTAWPEGILMAGILLGTVGVLDDVTVTQSETVEELAHANPNLSRKELFLRAMRLGRHHIASTVNTLVLAYVGAAMPLLLLSMSTPGMTIQMFLNTEQVAEEIVRTLAGTVALILAVPISTWLATYIAGKGGKTSHGHSHVHNHA